MNFWTIVEAVIVAEIIWQVGLFIFVAAGAVLAALLES